MRSAARLEVESFEEHMTSEEHRLAMEIDYTLRARFCLPRTAPDEG